MRGSLTLFLFLLLFLSPAGAQDLPETLQETLSERNESETDDDDLLMAVLEARRNPVNLNTCALVDLLALPGVGPALAAAILQHREKTGAFQSLYELQMLEGMDRELFQTLEGVFAVKTLERLYSSANSLSKVFGPQGSFEYLLLLTPLLQQRKGYAERLYAGPPLRHWHRLSWRPNDFIRIGLNMENDAGESLRWNKKQKGFDFYSGFVELQGKDKRNKLILGDFMTSSGQGLVHGRGRGFGSQAWVGRVYASAQSRVYRSSEENLFYRGVLAQHVWGKGIHKAFFSFHRVDGENAETDAPALFASAGETERVKKGTGMHRTESEYALKKGFRTLAAGQSLEYPLGKWRLGAQYLYTKEENKEDFHFGVSHSRQSGSRLWFGEWAVDRKGSLSLLQGMVWSLDKHLDVSVLFRRYPASQSNGFASGFSSFSKPENETGLYFSCEWKPNRKSAWRYYLDKAYRTLPSYLVSTPYMASAFFLETEQKLYGVKFLLRLREDRGKRDLSAEELIWKPTLDWKKRSLRLQMDAQHNEDLHFRTRLELASYRHGQQFHQGYLFFQDLQWKPKQKKYHLILRYQYFFIPDYDTRIYVYESDVLYAYSVPAYSGRGQRLYLVTRQHLFKGLDLWIKAGVIHYTDKTEIGSGNDLLPSNRVLDLKVMVRWVL